MAYHVKTHGAGGELNMESIYYMTGRETGLNKQALHDEKLVARIHKHVEQIEGHGHTYSI